MRPNLSIISHCLLRINHSLKTVNCKLKIGMTERSDV